LPIKIIEAIAIGYRYHLSTLIRIDTRTDKSVPWIKLNRFLIRRTVYFEVRENKVHLTMKLLLITFATICAASAGSFVPEQWREVKSPLDAPRYEEILSKIFPENVSAGRAERGGRIAGGELASLGQFIHQALLLTTDSSGHTYVCGGSIISHSWILTVKLVELGRN
jgi:hypothetical protein